MDFPKKQILAEQRRKRAQAASGLAQGAKKPPNANEASPAVVGRATAMPEPLPAMRYPLKKTALGRRQVALADD